MNEKRSKKDVKMRGSLDRSKSGIAILLVFAMLIMLAAVPVTANASSSEDVDYPDDYVIRNDESGIPDVNLYNGVLRNAGLSSDQELTVGKAKTIEELSLAGLNINDIRGISFLTNITGLYLRGNNLTSLKGMNAKKLTKLDTINLSYNNLVDIDEIKNLPQVVFLDVSHNQLEKLPDIRHFSNLRASVYLVHTTNFDYNKLTKSEMLNKLPKSLLEDFDGRQVGPDGRLETNLEWWLSSQTPDITDPSETQPADTQPNTDPSEIQPTEDTSSDNIITNDENGVPDTALYNILLEQCDMNNDGLIQKEDEANKIISLGIRSNEENQISSLKGLNLFINVKILIVESNYNLKSLDGIEQLRLDTLIARKNNLIDISQIGDMSETLSVLNVEDNNLVKLPNLNSFSKLQFINNYYGSNIGRTTSFLYNYLTYDELFSKLPEHLKNQIECENEFGDQVLIYDGKSLLEYWADFQKELPPVTNPTETQPNTDPSETQPADTQPNTDPSETQPAETQPDADPSETQPADTQPNTDPTETQPADTQPNTDPSETQPADTQPNTDPSETQPADTQPDTDPSETQPADTQPNTNSTEDDTQAETVAPTPDGSDNNGGSGNNGNSNNGNGVNNGNNANSGNNSGNSGASSSTGSQGKSAGTVNTGDNYFVFTLALVAMLASAFVLLKSKRKNKARYKQLHLIK